MRWTWTCDAQTLSMKVWASPVRRSSALRARTRPCRRRRSSRRRCRRRRSSRRRCRRRRSSRRRCVGRVAVGAVGVAPSASPGPAGTPVGSVPSVVISSSPRGLSGVVVMDPPRGAATDGPPRVRLRVSCSRLHRPTPLGTGSPGRAHLEPRRPLDLVVAAGLAAARARARPRPRRPGRRRPGRAARGPARRPGARPGRAPSRVGTSPRSTASQAASAVAVSRRPRVSPLGSASSVPENRWPPRCVVSHVPSGHSWREQPGDRAADLGAAPVALAVGADQPQRPVVRRQAGEVEVEEVLGPVEHRAADVEPVVGGAGVEDVRAGAGAAVVPPQQEDLEVQVRRGGRARPRAAGCR